MKKRSRDLTQGNIAKQILLFAIPILLSQTFQNLYNSVDSVVVGRLVGTTALAAVTASGDVSRLIISFFTGLSTGSGIVFSRYFGAKKYDDLHRATHTTLLFSALLGLFMVVLGITLTPVLMTLVACPPDVLSEAILYLRVYFIGTLFTSIYNVATGILRAVGDSRTPFYYLVIATCVNIVLDFFFVGVLHIDVLGVALATIISQLLSVALIIIKMLKTTDVYHLDVKSLHIDKSILSEVLRLGIPAAVQSCLTSFSNLFVLRYQNTFGSIAMAGTGAAKKIEKFVSMVSHAIGLSTATFVAQNVGAGKYKRTVHGMRHILVLSFIAVALIGLPIYIFAEPIVRLFTKDTAAIVYGVEMIRVMMPFYYLLALQNIFTNAIRGFGRSIVSMVLATVGLVACRQIYLAVAMAINYSIVHVYVSFPVGWGCATLLGILYYLLVIRKNFSHKLRSECSQ